MFSLFYSTLVRRSKLRNSVWKNILLDEIIFNYLRNVSAQSVSGLFSGSGSGWHLIAKTTIGLFSPDFLTKEGLDCWEGGDDWLI